MNGWRSFRNWLLIWLASSLLFAGYVFLASRQGETPNWLDALVFSGWAALVSRWLDPLAGLLLRRQVVRWAFVVLISVVLLVVVLPWALRLPVDGGLWQVDDAGRYYLSFTGLMWCSLFLTIPQSLHVVNVVAFALVGRHLEGVATPTEHVQAAGLALALGLGLTLLALSWRVTWQTLVGIPAIADGWNDLCHWIRVISARLRRTRTWRWLRQGLLWALVGLLLLDVVGVLLSVHSVAVEWEPIITTGFPPGPPFSVSALVVGPEGGGLFAGTYGGGAFRSDDGGASWRAVNQGLTSQSVLALAVEPEEGSLFAGTVDGVFRSDDGGASWRAASQGLTSLYVQALVVGPEGGSLFADTGDGGVSRSDDGGTNWRAVTDLPSNLPTDVTFGRIRLAASGGRVSLARPGMGWLPWAVYHYQPPQAFTIHAGLTRLYASAGAAMMLRAEAPLPVIWRAPTPYLALVAATWRVVRWVGANLAPLSVGLGLAAAAAFIYIYVGVARPNRLHPATMLWLLPRPRHLLASSAYRGYVQRWTMGDPLERLILLEAPPAAPFTAAELEATLHRRGAAFDAERLRLALAALAQRGLLLREDSDWRLVEPLLAQVQRRELGRDEPVRLAQRTRQEHPLYVEARRFLAQAGFAIQEVDPLGLLCTSALPLWRDISPLYVRLLLERALDLEQFQALCRAAEAAYGEDLRGHVVAVVIDRPPHIGDLHQIFALRAHRGLAVVPLPRSLMLQVRLDGREKEALREQVDLYLGRADLYDLRTAVSDVLSFFGRSAFLADLERRLAAGQSSVVFGVRKMGKSSLLCRLREACAWPSALVDLQGYSGGLGYVYGEALRGWRAAMIDAFPALAPPEWTGDFSAPHPAAQAQAFRSAVRTLLDMLADRPGRPGLLLFLDEVDTLYDQPDYPEFAAVLRSVAEDPHCRGRFALLAAGLDPALNRVDRIDSGRNPFYAFFSEAPLGPLDLEDARTMVISIGGQMGIAYTDEALDLLVKAGGGHPFLIRQLCSWAIRELERPATVDAGRAAWAAEEYVRWPRNYLAESLWGIDSGGPPAAEAALLRSLVTAQPQPDDLLLPSDLSPQERRSRQLALDHLRDQSLVRRVESGWELTLPLYRAWVRRVILGPAGEAGGE